MKRFAFLIPLLGVLGCTPAEKVVKIGLLLPTNASGDIATYAKEVKNGIYLAAKRMNFRVNGRKVEFVLPQNYDGSPDNAQAALEELLKAGARVVIGPLTSDEALKIKSLVEQKGVPTFVPTATADGLTEGVEWIWRVCVTNKHMAIASAYMSKGFLNVKEVAVLFKEGDPYSEELGTYFSKWAEKNGLRVVARETFNDSDIKPKLESVVGKFTLPHESTAVFAPFYYDVSAKVIRTLRDMDYKGYVVGADGWDVEEMPKEVGKPTGENYFITHFNPYDPSSSEFTEDYMDEYNESATSFAALGYDAFLVVADVLRRARASLTNEDIKVAASRINVSGVTGEIELSDIKRDPDTKSVVMMRLSDIGFQFVRRLAISPTL